MQDMFFFIFLPQTIKTNYIMAKQKQTTFLKLQGIVSSLKLNSKIKRGIYKAINIGTIT